MTCPKCGEKLGVLETWQRRRTNQEMRWRFCSQGHLFGTREDFDMSLKTRRKLVKKKMQ
jgi:hypothetical protein